MHSTDHTAEQAAPIQLPNFHPAVQLPDLICARNYVGIREETDKEWEEEWQTREFSLLFFSSSAKSLQNELTTGVY